MAVLLLYVSPGYLVSTAERRSWTELQDSGVRDVLGTTTITTTPTFQHPVTAFA